MSAFRFIRAFLIVLAFTLSLPSAAGPAEDAQAAYARDDYATALRIWRELAEQGNASAQNNLGFMYAQGRGVAKDDTQAVQWYRKAAEQGLAAAQANLGVMYANGRGVAKDEAEAVQWYRKAAEQGDTRAQTILSSIERQERDTADLTPKITALVKKYEAAQPAAPVSDAVRTALAREIIEATGLREMLSLVFSPEKFKESFSMRATNSKMPPKLGAAMLVTAIASFRSERILASIERGLSETLDSATLRAGLEWERSEPGRTINRLEFEASKPELQAAKKEFVEQFIKNGGVANDARARACAQKDILDNSTEAMLPLLEAFGAAGGMAAIVQQGQALDFDAIQRSIAGLRPILRDTARQTLLAGCLFSLRRLSDAEFDKWLEFLRTDLGGRYARGMITAQREAFLEAAEVFTRTLVDVARQLKGSGES